MRRAVDCEIGARGRLVAMRFLHALARRSVLGLVAPWLALIALSSAAQSPPIKFDPTRDLDGFEGLMHSEFRDLYPMARYDKLLGKDPQPAHMRDFKRIHDDNGGVHVNSGIPNHAFYLVARELGGRSWDHAGPVWYETLRDPGLRSNATFHDFAQVTVRAAQHRFGSGPVSNAVRDAWNQVGVTVP